MWKKQYVERKKQYVKRKKQYVGKEEAVCGKEEAVCGKKEAVCGKEEVVCGKEIQKHVIHCVTQCKQKAQTASAFVSRLALAQTLGFPTKEVTPSEVCMSDI